MENSAFTKLIINSVLMILTIILVWSDLKILKRIISIVLAITFIAINFYYDNKADTNANHAAHSAELKQHKDSTLNDSLTHAIISKADSLKTLQLSTKDSIKAAIESSYQHSVKVSNEALGKYSMQLQDSLQKLKVNANFGYLRIAAVTSHPTIYNDFYNERKYLTLQFSSGQGSVFNINLKYYVMSKRVGFHDFVVLDSGIVMVNNNIDINVVATIRCPVDSSLFTQKKLLVVIIGEYSIDYKNNEPRKFISSFLYDFANGKVIGEGSLLYNDFIKWRLRRVKS